MIKLRVTKLLSGINVIRSDIDGNNSRNNIDVMTVYSLKN